MQKHVNDILRIALEGKLTWKTMLTLAAQEKLDLGQFFLPFKLLSTFRILLNQNRFHFSCC